MYLIDQQYLETPYYGSHKMRVHQERQGYRINRKRVERVMRTMGVQAVYPRPRASIPGDGHKIYQYLLKGLKIDRPIQVWATGVACVPLAGRFINALEEALQRDGTPEIFSTEAGCPVH